MYGSFWVSSIFLWTNSRNTKKKYEIQNFSSAKSLASNFLTASSAAVLYVAFFSCCCSSWLFLPSLFVQFWLVQSPIGQLLSSAQFSSIQPNSAQFSSAKLSSAPVPFCLVLTCPIPHWTAGIFVCFRFIPNNSVQCYIGQVKTGQI